MGSSSSGEYEDPKGDGESQRLAIRSENDRPTIWG